MRKENTKHIALITAITDDWGGSEELWAKSIPMLRDKTRLTVYKQKINRSHPEFLKLKDQQVKLIELDPQLSLPKKLTRKAGQIIRRITASPIRSNHSVHKFYCEIKASKPDLVIVSQGINFDGLIYAYQCYLLRIPYVIIAQKAVEFYWPYYTDRVYMKETLLNAKKCFFVSHHNKQLTEEQFGLRLNNAEVIFNPIKTKTGVLPFPSVENGYRLALVARLFIIDKGQDILLRILDKEKWRNRPISVSLVGSGVDDEGIKDMINLLSINNVNFIGFQGNIETLWKDHHALILPSRSEGLPLSLLEAMSLGRTAIVSNAGGNHEIITDGVNGFIGDPTESDFEKAMERAWEMREKWHEIGEKACAYVKKNLPVSPEKEFANSIHNLLN